MKEEVDEDSTDKPAFSHTQWWADTTPFVEIEPIPFEQLKASAHGGLILNSATGIFLSPQTIAGLDFRAKDPARQGEVDRLATIPTGLADLPSPSTMTLDEWREIAAGALKLEAHVSSHIVEPLLRWLIADRDLSVVREYKIGKRQADFVIVDGEGSPLHVIEVKKRVKSAHGQPWEDTPDFAQVRWYADHLHVAATLIDSQRLMLVDHQGGEPTRILSRHDVTPEDLEDLQTHMLGSAGAGSATKRYRVHHGMDFQQRQFGTLETDDAGVVVGFTRDDGAEGSLFRSETARASRWDS